MKKEHEIELQDTLLLMLDRIKNLEENERRANLLCDERKTDAKLFWAIDERIDRVVEQFEEKINKLNSLVKDERNKRLTLSDRLGNLRIKDKDKIEELNKKFDNKIKVLNAKNQKRADAIKQLDNKIEALNKKVDNYEPKNIIRSLEVTAETIIKDKTSRLINKIYDLEVWKSKLNDMDRILLTKIDDLEAKNYQIKRELDGIYKVLEITDDQIEGLIEYNNKMESK